MRWRWGGQAGSGDEKWSRIKDGDPVPAALENGAGREPPMISGMSGRGMGLRRDTDHGLHREPLGVPLLLDRGRVQDALFGKLLTVGKRPKRKGGGSQSLVGSTADPGHLRRTVGRRTCLPTSGTGRPRRRRTVAKRGGQGRGGCSRGIHMELTVWRGLFQKPPGTK